MSSETTPLSNPPIILHFGQALAKFSDTEFYALCQLNRDWRIERTADGDLIIMPPTGGNMGRRNLAVSTQLGIWSERDGSGVAFDSSTGFCLPGGARRSPDAAWVRCERWEALSETDREEFPPLAPDFVIELRSRSDPLDDLRAKMREYIASGVRLAWLIDPASRFVEVYRPSEVPVAMNNPSTLPADPELPGFVLDLVRIW